MNFSSTSRLDPEALDEFRHKARRSLDRLDELVVAGSPDVMILFEVRCLASKAARYLATAPADPLHGEPDPDAC